MKIAAIIAEYNPLHQGHRYHMEKARELSGADYVVAALSGDFVQRGAPAVFDKYQRTQMALLAGADLVLEIPSVFAAGSAEDFAFAGVALLSGLGADGFLIFGSEAGDTAPLLSAASILNEEPEGFQALLRSFLSQGLSYPLARERALSAFSGTSEISSSCGVFSSPNNILGIEYCRALLKQQSQLKPLTVLRRGGYHDPGLIAGSPDPDSPSCFSSASAIRKAIQEWDMEKSGDLWEALSSHIPQELRSFYDAPLPLYTDDLSLLLNTAILSLSHSGRSFADYEGFSPELAARLGKHLYSASSWEGRIAQLKTKNYTYTRISRALLHLVLGVTKGMCQAMRENGYAPYARILGFRKNALPLLSYIKRNTSVPLITKTADSERAVGPEIFSFLQQDFYASHIYQAVRSAKYRVPAENEFTRQITIL